MQHSRLTFVCTYVLYFDKMSPLNGSCTIGSSERNKRHPQIVVVANTRGAQTLVLIILADTY